MPKSNPTPNPIPEYRLRIETGDAGRAVVFRLYDSQGVLAADRALTLPDPLPSLWEGLFDTQRYVELRAGNQIWQDEPHGQPDTPEAILERLGVFLGREVLGEEIMTVLTRSRVRRALAVHLPGGDSPLAAALARAPWEIARPHPGAKPLMDTNLVPRLALVQLRLSSDTTSDR
ncbi:MAG: hypothetical protein BECKG1743D_GA0114223_105313 [Candidatus Kentron sp. G]|nr:MAG: hypothetical protein BECKG1743F_GA0114225_104114 [Candidatus Kentron sp. G]VFN02152.1 MAG: hypothetical protein BECKG1743E_GA0114224_104782 [Candidatus Kentron sp. G]VFN03948.1 MAG: hypothetical protein BECKG1743D_GA0114223_105313 [Candidatus Kentron sp. G]